MHRKWLIAALGLLAITTAQAADNGAYFGAGITRTNLEVIDSSSFGDFKDDDTGYKLIAGFRPLDWLGLEVNYIDFGNITEGNSLAKVDYSLTGTAAFAVGFFELPFVDLYAKAGLLRSNAELSVRGSLFPSNLHASNSDTDFAYGAGVQARLGSLAARLEYERFNVEDTDKVDSVTLGVTWTFL